MRIVIAPDKFKGSLEASAVAEALEAGICSVEPTADVVRLPVADGGEGTLEAAAGAGFARRPVTVTGPVGEPVEAEIAVLGSVAVIEMAQASGLAALPVDIDGDPVLEPGGATSRGTGELILAALDAGMRRVVIGVGGSASTDGGAGLLQALGARLLDAEGDDLTGGGVSLAGLDRVDLSGMDPRVTTTEFILAADVDNPLTGLDGAAAVFGPQKGASRAMVTVLDGALDRLRDRLTAALGPDVSSAAEAPGAGAAGGVGFAALAVLGAVRRPGIEVVLEFVDLAGQVASADLVITGEGSLDDQSLGGKTPLGVAAVARSAGVPVVAVCGRTTLPEDILREAGFARTYALTELEPNPQTSMREAARLLERLGARLASEMPALARAHHAADTAPVITGADDQETVQ
ncbi:glycerate kinase [Cellulosimicrobium funkei]|nr:glycerate kinase [Cellulosimicrobium funkei]